MASYTHPWRPIRYKGVDYRNHSDLARKLYLDDPERSLVSIAKSARCTVQCVSTVTRRLRQATWRPSRYGKVIFPTRSAKVRYYLAHTQLSQAEIAERCQVSGPRVSQIAHE
jgi:hypothetical protein